MIEVLDELTKEQRILRERSLDIYSTGKYGSRKEAMEVAKQQVKREKEKQEQQKDKK